MATISRQELESQFEAMVTLCELVQKLPDSLNKRMQMNLVKAQLQKFVAVWTKEGYGDAGPYAGLMERWRKFVPDCPLDLAPGGGKGAVAKKGRWSRDAPLEAPSSASDTAGGASTTLPPTESTASQSSEPKRKVKDDPRYKILREFKAAVRLSEVRTLVDRQKSGQIDCREAIKEIKKVVAAMSDTDEDYEGEHRIQIPKDQCACPSM